MKKEAAAMGEFAAPLTLCAVTSFIGSILTRALQFIRGGNFNAVLEYMSIGTLAGYMFLRGTVSGLCTGFQAWCIRQRGPVLVPLFSSIGTVCSAVLSALTLGEGMSLGSITGMLLLFIGLYIVLWAKKKEGYVVIEGDGTLAFNDVKKPLLS